MADWESPLKKQLRSFVNKEFENYISVPSLAEATDFGILYMCSPLKPALKSDDQPNKKSWFGKAVSWPSNLSQAADLERSPNIISLGWLFDYCSDNSSKVKSKEEPVCIQGWDSTSQLSGCVEILSADTGCGGSLENKTVLNLGKIAKISLPYKEVNEWVKGVTTHSSPELYKEARRNQLYVIYEVLTAEQLKNVAEENSNVEGNVSGIASGSWKRNKDSRLSRPKSMGRFIFAYKCGKVKAKKNKKHLELVGPKEFYKPFSVKDENESPATASPSQSQTSSQEQERSNDDFINLKNEDNKDES